MAWDYKQCGILTCVDSDEPVQPPFKLRNSKWCSVSSLTLIEYSSNKQRLWSDCAYAQADLRLCWSHIPHCWKSHAHAHIIFYYCGITFWEMTDLLTLLCVMFMFLVFSLFSHMVSPVRCGAWLFRLLIFVFFTFVYGRGFETYRRHCVVVLEQDTFILA